MNYFELDFTYTPKIGLVGKEHLLPPRKHTSRCTDEHIIYFILTGKLNLLINGEAFGFLPGDFCFFKRGTVQQPLDTNECEYYYIHFADDNLASHSFDDAAYEAELKNRNLNYTKSSIYGFERMEYFKVLLPQRLHFREGNSFLFAEEKLRKLNKEFKRKEFEARMNLPHIFEDLILFCESIAENSLFEKKGGNNYGFSIVKNVADFINENFYRDIGKKSIEEKFSFNYDYINRIFKRMMGESIVKYRNSVRIDNAKNLLKTTELTLEEISERVGFGDKYYFVRCFTKKVGIHPILFKNTEKDNAL